MRKEIELDLSEFIGLRVIEAIAGSVQFDQGRLRTECTWRLRNKGGIFVSSAECDGESTREKANAIFRDALLGATIRGITIYAIPCDLVIELDNDLYLDILPVSAQFESWNLERRQGRHFVGMPGGKITWF